MRAAVTFAIVVAGSLPSAQAPAPQTTAADVARFDGVSIKRVRLEPSVARDFAARRFDLLTCPRSGVPLRTAGNRPHLVLCRRRPE